jgi:hypothetical protein
MLSFITIAAAIGGAALLWRWLSGPSPIALSSPPVRREVFRMTLTNGTEGARVRFQLRRDPRFRLDFRKYIEAPGRVGLRAVLESARFAAIREIFERQQVPYVVTHSVQGVELIEVDLGTDTVAGETVARCAFEESLGVDLAKDVVGYYDLVLIKNVPRLTGVG